MPERLTRESALSHIVPELEKLRRAAVPDKLVLVAVVGGSAVGKGHFIEELVRALGGRAVTLALDDYYIGKAAMAERGVPHFDHPEAIDLVLAAEHLRALKAGEAVEAPVYDFPSGERVGSKPFVPAPFVVVDGLFALATSELAACYDYGIFIDADHYTSMLRRLFRDAGPDGRTRQSSRAVLEQYFTTVAPAKREFIDPQAVRADVILASRYDAGRESLRAGPLTVEIKYRGWRDDDTLHAIGARRLASIKQVDRYLEPRHARLQEGEILRLRWENGTPYLTYKGPFLPGDSSRPRPVSSAVELAKEDVGWFSDEYAYDVTVDKSRTIFSCGDLTIARDLVKGLGAFTEIRATLPAEGPDGGSAVRRIGELAKRLKLPSRGETAIASPYVDLVRETRRRSSFADL
jgi:uridine kinase